MKTIKQLTLEDVKRLAAQGKHGDIEEARLAGKLNVILGGHAPVAPDARLTLDDVRLLASQGRHEEIAQAREDGRIDYEENQ